MKASNVFNEIGNFVGLIFITLVMLPFLAAFFLFNLTASIVVALSIIILNCRALFLMDKEKVELLYKKHQEIFCKNVLLVLFGTLVYLLGVWFFDKLSKPADQMGDMF